MFRHGGLLYDNFNKDTCGEDCNKIKVYDWSDVQVGDEIVIFTEPDERIYYNSADEKGIIPPPAPDCPKSNYLPKSDCEVAIVSAISEPQGGAKVITLNSNLGKNYFTAKNSETNKLDFANLRSAGFGVLSRAGQSYDCDLKTASKTCFYNADISEIAETFSDGFVFVYNREEGSGALPYIPLNLFSDQNKQDRMYRLRQIWFSNKKSKDCYDCSGCCNDSQNYFHLIGASEDIIEDFIWTGWSRYETDASYIFVKRIEEAIDLYCQSNYCNGDEIMNNLNHTSAHELAHEFRVNSCHEFGHDDNNAWCGNEGGTCLSDRVECGEPIIQWCAMHTLTTFKQTICQQSNGIIKFDCSDLSANPLCNVPDCSGNEKISIRTDTDPE